MYKYKNFSDIYFKKRSDYLPVNNELDEISKDWKFIQPFLNKYKEVHVIDINYNVPWNFHSYTNYWVCIGSTQPDAILGIDFIIVLYYVPDSPMLPTLKYCSFYLVVCGPSLKYNPRIGTQWNTSIVMSPASAIFFKRLAISSYATELSDFLIACCMAGQRKTLRLINRYFPNLLKQPSKHKNKAYCKVNNKYIKEMKKLGLFPDKNKEN
ncbi:hypothetical protein [Ureaplasma ceti]|uniref:UBC core domain-containing protein n=1 Tax=Ureaplasma ceti TaxID=3119530 RepID=A0ABP9UBQ0_9BACT